MMQQKETHKISISPAFLLALSDQDFILYWNQGNESDSFIIDQPVGLDTFNNINERAKKLGLKV